MGKLGMTDNDTAAPRARTRVAGRALERLLAFTLAFLLLRSSFAHLGNPYSFLSHIYSYQATGIDAGQWVAVVIPFVQIVAAVCLLVRWWLGEAYLLCLLMFTVFAGTQALALRRGLQISCGCFGAAESLQISARTIAVAGCAALASAVGGLLTIAAARGLDTNRKNLSPPPGDPTDVSQQTAPGLLAH